MSEERERESLPDETRAAIEEVRMVLPGMQALFGFQLIAVFNERFDQLSASLRLAHFGSLILVAIAIALVMAPAAFHRIAERGWVSRHLIDLTSNFLTSGMLALFLALVFEVGVVSTVVLHSVLMSALISAGLAVVFALCWFIFPLRLRQHHRRSRKAGSSAR